MVALSAGAVVLVRFPFSDLSQTELRPAVILADAGRGDVILCQVTSQAYGDANAIELKDTSLASGSLRVTSYARPGKLFTANRSLITSQVGGTEVQRTAEDRSSGGQHHPCWQKPMTDPGSMVPAPRGPNHTLERTGLTRLAHRERPAPAAQREPSAAC